MDNLFSDLSQILPKLAELQSKIDHLRLLSKQLKDGGQIARFVLIDINDYKFVIDQSFVPFNLDQEIQILLRDAIEHWQSQHDHLDQLSNLNF